MNDSQISKLLFALEGIGAIFLGAFLIAYLMGLPTYTVYHSDPTLRMLLSFLGALLLILVLIALLISALNTKKDSIKITLSLHLVVQKVGFSAFTYIFPKAVLVTLWD